MAISAILYVSKPTKYATGHIESLSAAYDQ